MGWLSIVFCILYAVLCVLIIVQHFFTLIVGKWLYWSFIGLVVCIAVLPSSLRFVTRLKITEMRNSFSWLLALCMLVKIGWVLMFPTVPASDYLTFYKTAQLLAENWTIDFRYVALFPHIMGYSTFLSLFFLIFGDNLLIAPIVNAVLSTVSMALIYYIVQQCWHKQAAWIAAIIWIFYPSQTIYNSMVLSEPYYTTMILTFWALIIWLNEKLEELSLWKIGLAALPCSLLLTMIHAARPIAIILYIALMIWFVLSMDWHNKKQIVKRITLSAAITVFLWGFVQINTAYNTSRLGDEPASTPGFNILVGFNEKSGGEWNEEDSKQLSAYLTEYPEWSAKDVQYQLLRDAKERIFNSDIAFLKFFYTKLHLLWGDDSLAYQYSDIETNQTSFHAASNAYYYFTMIFSIIGLFIIVRKDKKSSAVMFCLFILGLTAAHLLAEVANRYHYSGIAVMTMLAAIGVHCLRYSISLRLPGGRYCETCMSGSRHS